MNEKAFLVLSVRNIRKILKAANAASKRSSAHPGRLNLNHCIVLETTILGPEHTSEDGMRHLSSTDFMDSLKKV